MFTIIITLSFIIIGQISALILYHLNNRNNDMVNWKHPSVLLVSFCLNWVLFLVQLYFYFKFKKINY